MKRISAWSRERVPTYAILFAMEYAGARYFYQKNLQGDIIGLIDSTGMEVVTYTYDTWGKLLSKTDGSGNGLAEKNPFRYRGYYYDAEVGLYWLQSRYYDSETRRFVNADGYVSTSQGLNGNNMFIYCGNNPINNVDPSGMLWEKIKKRIKKVKKSIKKASKKIIKFVRHAVGVGGSVVQSRKKSLVKVGGKWSPVEIEFGIGEK